MSITSHASLFAPPPPQGSRRELVGLSRGELEAFLAGLGEPPFRARQLWRWIYNRGATDLQAMTDLGKPLRARLERNRAVVDRNASDGQVRQDQRGRRSLQTRDFPGQCRQTLHSR